ncbi:MAG: hypothetical protein J7M38_11275 [Armatimonadetes bacterium]|nr:hypothetical protein [Armatimonadota bacterium]
MWRRTSSSTVAAIILISIGLGAGGVQAATITVGPGGAPTYDYATIQAGIDAASSGDTIQVASGTYYENIIWTDKTLQIVGTAPCTVDGSDFGSVFYISNVSSPARLEGFIITNGNADGAGGGLMIIDSTLTVVNNTITDNAASTEGGGVEVSGGAPTLRNNEISLNTAGNLGAGVNALNSDMVLDDNMITTNRCTGGTGGGVAATGGDGMVVNNIIQNNWAYNAAGGLLLVNGSSRVVMGNKIISNTASSGNGGGVVLRNEASPFGFNEMRNNQAGGSGGGIAIEVSGGATPGDLYNNLICENTASSGTGGGVFGTSESTIGSLIDLCTIAANVGGGIASNEFYLFQVTNSIVYGNNGAPDITAGCMANYSCFTAEPVPPGEGNFAADPLFAGTGGGFGMKPAALFDYHLKSRKGRWSPASTGWVIDAVHSPCIDAGDPEEDYSHEPEDNGDRVNLGAYGNTEEASKGGPINIPPSAPVVDVTPDNPRTDDDLICVIVTPSVDLDGTTVIYRYRWYLDGVRQTDLDEHDRVPARRTRRGQTWTCKVIPTDGIDRGEPDEDTVTVLNTPPTVETVVIQPRYPSAHDDLTAVPAGWHDPDDDPPGYLYQWQEWTSGKAGWVDIPGETRNVLTSDKTSVGDKVRVVCTPYDGIRRGPSVTAQEKISGRPVLSWVGTGPFTSGPCHPLRGPADGLYMFKVRYTGAAPTYVRMRLFRDGVEVAASPHDMIPGDGAPGQGMEFWYQRPLRAGTYSCLFEASDGHDAAVGDPTLMFDGPVSGNMRPQLAWAGYGPWTDDPVDPQGVQHPGAEFVWKVRYSDPDGDPAQYVRLHLTMFSGDKAGVGTGTEIPGSPFDMTPEEGGDPQSGQVFTCTNTLVDEGEYICWFEARDLPPKGLPSLNATGAPGRQRRMVIIRRPPPRLEYVRESAAVSADDKGVACSPDAGRTGDTFHFRVLYTHPLGTEPAYVRLHLLRWNGVEWVEALESPYDMTAQGSDFTACEFTCDVAINRPGRYRHIFSASDGVKDARGEPTRRRLPGPVVTVNHVPELAWLGIWGYENDGVQRAGASPADTFTWAVRYRDEDGDPAQFARVHIFRLVDGEEVELPDSPFDMLATGSDWAGGVDFLYTGRLTEPGLYGYWFEAADAWDDARGVPARRHMRGPRVRDPFAVQPLMVTAAVALPTHAGGAQVTFTLSAPAAVSAEVLNIAGRRVATLAGDRQVQAGANTLSWNGCNSGGLRVPAGVYLIRLCARGDNGAQTQTMVPVHLSR